MNPPRNPERHVPIVKQRRHISSIITRASGFLLLAAIVNVAVAWGCALWAPLQVVPLLHYQHHMTITERPWWYGTWRHSGWPDSGLPLFIEEKTGPGVSAQQYSGFAWNCTVYQNGWPTHSLQHAAFLRPADPGSPHGARGLRIGNHSPVDVLESDRTFVPVQPIWPGFAINTVVYAAIFWLLFTAPFALHRRWRIKRGLCAACAYPIGDSPVCTECGKPVRSRRVEPPRS